MDLEVSPLNTFFSQTKKDPASWSHNFLEKQTYLDHLNTMQNTKKARAAHC